MQGPNLKTISMPKISPPKLASSLIFIHMRIRKQENNLTDIEVGTYRG
jgi:hypothetical protein